MLSRDRWRLDFAMEHRRSRPGPEPPKILSRKRERYFSRAAASLMIELVDIGRGIELRLDEAGLVDFVDRVLEHLLVEAQVLAAVVAVFPQRPFKLGDGPFRHLGHHCERFRAVLGVEEPAPGAQIVLEEVDERGVVLLERLLGRHPEQEFGVAERLFHREQRPDIARFVRRVPEGCDEDRRVHLARRQHGVHGRELGFDDGDVLAGNEAVLLQHQARGHVERAAEGVDRDGVTFQVLHRLDRRVLLDGEPGGELRTVLHQVADGAERQLRVLDAVHEGDGRQYAEVHLIGGQRLHHDGAAAREHEFDVVALAFVLEQILFHEDRRDQVRRDGAVVDLQRYRFGRRGRESE